MSNTAVLASRNTSAVKDKRKLLLLSLFLLFAGAFLIRVWGLSYFHYWDEWAYLQDAKVICCGKTNYSELSFRPPLLSLLFAGAFLIRDHVFSACVATAALNALGPVLLFLSGRKIVGTLPAALASLLLAFGPFFVGVFPPGFDSDDTGNSLLTDSPALTLIVLGFWLMVRALENQKAWRFILAGFGLSLALLMRFGSIPAVGVLFLLPLMAKRRWSSLAAAGGGFVLGFGPYLLWSQVAYGGFFETIRQGWSHVEGAAPPFAFYLSNAPIIFTWIGLIGLFLAACAGVAGLVELVHRDSAGATELTLGPSPEVLQAFLWMWLIAAFIFFSRMPHKEPRYIMPLAPPLLLLSGSGLAVFCDLPGRALRRFGIIVLTVSVVLALIPSRSRFHGPFVVSDHTEEMDASQFLNSSFPATSLYMNFNYPAFAYFTNFKIHELPIGGPEVYSAIADMPEGGILVAYRENESGDPKISALDRDPDLEAVKQYSTLVIYRRVESSNKDGSGNREH